MNQDVIIMRQIVTLDNFVEKENVFPLAKIFQQKFELRNERVIK